MPKFVRSAKGELIDFNLMALKAQISAAPVPNQVKLRKEAIVEKDTGRQAVSEDANDFLAIASAAAEISANTTEE